MSDTSGPERAPGTVALALAAVAVLVVAGGSAVAGAATSSTIHDSPANLTINPVAPSDHHPGETNASYQIFATGEDAVDKDIERLSYAVIRYPAGDVSSCTAFSTSVFGVDRGNDDAGTKTDESLVSHQEESGHSRHEIYVDFYDEGDLGGESTHLYRDDQIVAYDKDCYVNPSEPGWYQFTGKINGTAADGSEVTVEVDSHYFYICDCADRSEAESKLGPPPSGSPAAPDGNDTGGATPTATPTTTPSPESSGGDPSTVTATATPTDAGRARATTAEPTATATATPTSSDGDGAAATATATAATTDTVAGAAPARTATATRASDGGDGGRTAVGPGGTPTYADGPGFGIVAVLLGLLAAALLGRQGN